MRLAIILAVLLAGCPGPPLRLEDVHVASDHIGIGVNATVINGLGSFFCPASEADGRISVVVYGSPTDNAHDPARQQLAEWGVLGTPLAPGEFFRPERDLHPTRLGNYPFAILEIRRDGPIGCLFSPGPTRVVRPVQ